jgi:hypothetical protein
MEAPASRDPRAGLAPTADRDGLQSLRDRDDYGGSIGASFVSESRGGVRLRDQPRRNLLGSLCCAEAARLSQLQPPRSRVLARLLELGSEFSERGNKAGEVVFV